MSHVSDAASPAPLHTQRLPDSAPARSRGVLRFASQHHRLLLWCMMIAAIGFSLKWGMDLRRWAFTYHEPLRFFSDIQRGFYWGHQSFHNGILEPYEIMANQPSNPAGMHWLDYAPLRLGAMTFWAWVNSIRYPDASHYRESYDFAKPILFFNLGIEILFALGLFLLTRHWMRRSNPDVFFGGNLHALGAALFAWFNPALILSAHCWPTWDIWVPAFFVWAVYMAVIDWWLLCGFLIGLGVMTKGQLFFVMPMFLLWPLFLGKWTAPLKWLIGGALGVAMIASPWLLTHRVPEIGRTLDWWAFTFVALSTLATLAALILLRRRLSPKLSGYILAAVVSGALLLCTTLFDGHASWMKVSWGFGTRHWDAMMTGTGSNLASILQERFGWRNPHAPAIGSITIKQLLFGIYGVSLLLCCAGIAMHYRRNDRRFLLAIVVPWVLFFAFCPKLHERYLVYAAAAGSLFVAISLGATLLNVVLSTISYIMTIHVMFHRNGSTGLTFGADISPTFGRTMLRVIEGTFPDVGYVVILCALVLLYLAITPSRRKRHEPLTPASPPGEASSSAGNPAPSHRSAVESDPLPL